MKITKSLSKSANAETPVFFFMDIIFLKWTLQQFHSLIVPQVKQRAITNLCKNPESHPSSIMSQFLSFPYENRNTYAFSEEMTELWKQT